MNKKNTSFRYDINSLRAYSVLAVLFYHFVVPGFSGGFIGVDVFFVLSGYLMTQVIMKGLESNSFSLRHFYLARVWRILPSLIILSIVLMLGGWFILASREYQELAKEVIASLLFLSNILFYRETGYFDADAHDKWLLHTWSLSIEWQFYLFFPIFLILCWRWFRTRRALFFSLLAIFLCSLLSCLALEAIRIASEITSYSCAITEHPIMGVAL